MFSNAATSSDVTAIAVGLRRSILRYVALVDEENMATRASILGVLSNLFRVMVSGHVHYGGSVDSVHGPPNSAGSHHDNKQFDCSRQDDSATSTASITFRARETRRKGPLVFNSSILSYPATGN